MDIADPQKKHGLSVHQILAQGYLLYLAAIVIGFGASYLFPEHVSIPFESSWGFVLIVAGTGLVFWAQRASGKTSHTRNQPPEKICKDHFCVGPYVFTRSPTQYGLFIMTLGLSLLFGSLYMVIGTVVAFLIGKFVIIPQEEKHLEAKYGQPYLDYKKHVKF